MSCSAMIEDIDRLGLDSPVAISVGFDVTGSLKISSVPMSSSHSLDCLIQSQTRKTVRKLISDYKVPWVP